MSFPDEAVPAPADRPFDDPPELSTRRRARVATDHPAPSPTPAGDGVGCRRVARSPA